MRRCGSRFSALSAAGLLLTAVMLLVGSAGTWALEAQKLRVWHLETYKDYSRQDLRGLPTVTVRTHTPWNDADADYLGVPVDIMAAQFESGSGSSLALRASNEYWIFSTVGEYVDAGAIIAFEMNGSPIKVSDKGPFVIVFPWKQKPSLENERFHALAVWYLEEIWIDREPK